VYEHEWNMLVLGPQGVIRVDTRQDAGRPQGKARGTPTCSCTTSTARLRRHTRRSSFATDSGWDRPAGVTTMTDGGGERERGRFFFTLEPSLEVQHLHMRKRDVEPRGT
jgi:hypothetical protein